MRSKKKREQSEQPAKLRFHGETSTKKQNAAQEERLFLVEPHKRNKLFSQNLLHFFFFAQSNGRRKTRRAWQTSEKRFSKNQNVDFTSGQRMDGDWLGLSRCPRRASAPLIKSHNMIGNSQQLAPASSPARRG